eukprot:scaffold88629_cov59-Phaeocystis_antarctica.AAC.3
MAHLLEGRAHGWWQLVRRLAQLGSHARLDNLSKRRRVHARRAQLVWLEITTLPAICKGHFVQITGPVILSDHAALPRVLSHPYLHVVALLRTPLEREGIGTLPN